MFPILVIFGTERQCAEETVTFSEALSSVLQQSSCAMGGGKERDGNREMEIERDVIIVSALG